MDGVSLAVSVVAVFVIVFGLVYVATLSVLGFAVSRRSGVRVPDQERLLDTHPFASSDVHGYSFFFLVPALNEQEVIGGTIAALLRDQPGATVVVLDDGSDDDTATIAASHDPARVLVVRRVAPNARLGKGKALNAGLAVIRERVGATGLPVSKVIVAVMDADGRMTPNATAAVADCFIEDPSVGGLQLIVRIRNRDNLALWFQDMEFFTISAIGQFGRVPTGSVSLGGNGQFTRLAALDEVGVEPWSESLTEDLDLGISLSVLGWRTTSTPWAYVTQQGVGDLRRLVRQRTRWYQGHMMAIRRLPELARSRVLPTGRFMEMTAYLAMPWVISLPWSIIQQYLLVQILIGHGVPAFRATSVPTRLLLVFLWYVLSFAPHVFWGITYFRRSRSVPLWRALLMAHLVIPWSYVSHLAVWRALGRIVLRRNAWSKTVREAEDGPGRGGSPVPADPVV